MTIFLDSEVQAYGLLLREKTGVTRGWVRYAQDRLQLRGTKTLSDGKTVPFETDWALTGDGSFTAHRGGRELPFTRTRGR